MGRELQIPQREIKTHRFHVERRELEGVFPSFSILLSGKRDAIRKNTQEASTEEHSTKWVSSALPRRSISGHCCRHKKVFFGAGIPQTHSYTFSKFTPIAQRHCKIKHWPESELHPKTSPGASSPARISAPHIPHGTQGPAAAAESSTGRFGAC